MAEKIMNTHMISEPYIMKINITATILIIFLSQSLCISSTAQPAAKTITDGHHTITYTSLLDAKKKILEYREQLKKEIFKDKTDEFRYQRQSLPMIMFEKLLRNEPLSNYYGFGFNEIKEIVSPDMKIKYYHLEDTHTAAGDYEGILVVTNGKGHEVTPIYDGPDIILNTECIRHIDCITTIERKTIYIFEGYDGRSDFFTLDGTKLLPMKFEVDEDRLKSIPDEFSRFQ